MKKFARLVCGVAVVALLGANIEWPVMLASAEDTNTAQQSAPGDGDTAQAGSTGFGYLKGQAGAGDKALPGVPGNGEAQEPGASGTSLTDEFQRPGTPGTGTGETQEPGMPGAGTDETQRPGTPGTGTGETQEPGTPGAGTDETQRPGTPGAGSGETQEPGTPGTGTGETQESGTPGTGTGETQEPGTPGTGTGETQGSGTSGTVEGLGEFPGEGDGKAAGQGWKRSSGSMDEETAQWLEEAGESLAQIAAGRDIMALVYLSDEYPVRRQPSPEADIAVTVLSGQTVNILDVYVDDGAEVWYYVKLEYNGTLRYGYVQRTYLACSDARFLEWEEAYGMNPGASAYTVDAEGRTAYPDIEEFPESYRPALLALKQAHPNWTFVKMNTGLDWGASISNEIGEKSLVYKTLPDWAKNGLYDKGTWYYASEAALKVYMDPRNGLSESAIFQFEQLTYNEAYHTLEAVNTFLKSTFMNDSKPAPGTSTTYANLFWTIGQEEGRKVSPFHLAARVLQEQGAGTSPLISGTYPGYEGYYNYFNVGASGTTNAQVYRSGLEYAKNHGWSSVEASIRGGADFISANYIKKGQDTLYLQKFNVNPNGAYKPYTHQYMQNITAPTTEASSIRRLYEGAGALNSPFVFKIPVYENMPGEPCGAPVYSTEVILTLPEGFSDTVMWLDGVAYQGQLRGGSLVAAAPNGNAKTAVLYKYNEAGVPIGMYAWNLSHNGVVYTATPLPGLEDLLTYHGFSIRITGKTGIRFKTGISAELRGRLLAGGVDGYTLKEYGTLVTSNANLGQYPMVKGGEKIVSGLSYGTNADGTRQDVIFETVDGRYRFTSVLVGLPVEQYKTEFAFRGYAVLEKGGVQTILYGPVVARSIYGLAGQLLGQGTYPAGSEADAFLRKLIGDADALAAP